MRDFTEAAVRDEQSVMSYFWLRKTRQPVLAVLAVQKPQDAQPTYFRGVNVEVSMPTGSRRRVQEVDQGRRPRRRVQDQVPRGAAAHHREGAGHRHPARELQAAHPVQVVRLAAHARSTL